MFEELEKSLENYPNKSISNTFLSRVLYLFYKIINFFFILDRIIPEVFRLCYKFSS